MKSKHEYFIKGYVRRRDGRGRVQYTKEFSCHLYELPKSLMSELNEVLDETKDI